MTKFVVLIPKPYLLGHLITLYCSCTLCARNIACTERARGMVGTQTPINTCFRSQHYECSHLALFWKRFETILKKKKKFTQGPSTHRLQRCNTCNTTPPQHSTTSTFKMVTMGLQKGRWYLERGLLPSFQELLSSFANNVF